MALQAIPALGDRKRIEIPSIYEGSINAAIRIHPPTADGASYPDGSDNLRQLTAAEVLLALQEQLAEPLSSLRTGPFGEYASYTTIGEKANRYASSGRTAPAPDGDIQGVVFVEGCFSLMDISFPRTCAKCVYV